MRKSKTYDLVLIAMYSSMFIVVDYLSNITIPGMINGGSFGLSTIILLLASYQLGWKKGVTIALITIPLGWMVSGQIYVVGIQGLFLDYIIPFTAYGFASVFINYKWFYSGVLISNIIRFISHTIAGIVLWQTPLWASMQYQAVYMIPTTIVGLIMVPILIKTLKRITDKNSN